MHVGIIMMKQLASNEKYEKDYIIDRNATLIVPPPVNVLVGKSGNVNQDLNCNEWCIISPNRSIDLFSKSALPAAF